MRIGLNLSVARGKGSPSGPTLVYSAIAGTCSANAADTVNANSRLTVNSNGTWQLTVSNGTGTPNPNGSQTYVQPIIGTPGNSLWIRATIVSGSFSNGPASGVITALSAPVVWNKGSTSGAFSVVFNVEILGDAAGTIVLSTGQVTLGYTHV